MPLARRWWTLIAVCTAIFMLLLDISIVNVALPSIQRSFHATLSDLEWVIDAYALTLAAFMLTAGVVGDMFGRREVFAIGLGVFSVSSLLCGVSQSSLMLNLCRAAQGVGGAIMFATSLALIAQAFRGRDRATAFGIYGAVLGGAVAVGPLLGGVITSGIGWRWIFFVNVPIGVVAIAVTLGKVDRADDIVRRRIDWLGFGSFSVALFLLVLALVRAPTDGWASPLILTLVVVGGTLLVVFMVGELRQRQPMLDMSLFRRPAMTGVSLTAFSISASIFALFLFLTLYLQDDLGYSALGAGLRLMPVTVLAFVVAPVAGKLTDRVQAKLLMGMGLLVIAVGLVLMTQVGASSGWTALLPGFVVGGFGIGMVNPVLASSAVAVVPPARSGMASGANNTFRQIGLATGIAALGTIFDSQMRSNVTSSLLATPAGREVARLHGAHLATTLSSGQVTTTVARWPHAQAQALLDAYHQAFASSFDHLAVIAAVVAFIGAVGTFALVRQRDFVAIGPAASGGHGAPDGPSPTEPGGSPVRQPAVAAREPAARPSG